MIGIVLKAFLKLAARWHGHWLRVDTARLEKLLEKGEPYTSPKLAKLSGRCKTHGLKAVRAAKKGGFYKRGRVVHFPYSMIKAGQMDALER